MRIITSRSCCPEILVDHVPLKMAIRSPAQFPHFPIWVWEASLPDTFREIAVDNNSYTISGKPFRKLAFIGDTGCRPDQPCEPDKWPLQQVARHVAKEEPDLIVHLGDYIYRHLSAQKKCCPDHLNFHEGDTWQGWQKEFFEPLGELLQQAPWIMVRGNQEGCDRAPHGWQMFLDPYPFKATCTPYNQPYIISLGQIDILVHDSSSIYPDKEALLPRHQLNNPGLSLQRETWLLTHQPPWGLVMDKKAQSGNNIILNEHNYIQRFLEPFPASLTAIFSGHVHAFQYIKLASTPVHQFVIGNSGVGLEENRPPEVIRHLKTDDQEVLDALSLIEFGYSVIHLSDQGWTLQAKNLLQEVRKEFSFNNFPQ